MKGAEGVVDGYLPPPTHALGKLWNELVHRVKPIRWADDWWWERARVPQEVGSFVNEGAIYGIGALVELVAPALIPAVILITTARIASHIDEFHMGYQWLRHHDKTLFDKPQLWRRNRDGSKSRMSFDPETGETAAAEIAALAKDEPHGVKQWFSDIWTERRRLPGFVFGLSLLALGFVLGSVFHAPVALVAAIEYFTLVQQQLPSPRNIVLAIKEKNWDFILRAQVAHAERNRRLDAERQARGHGITVDDAGGPAAVAPGPVAPMADSPAGAGVRRVPGVASVARTVSPQRVAVAQPVARRARPSFDIDGV